MASRLRKAGYGLTVAGALAVGFVGGKQGVSTRAYCDIAGVPTICFVETPDVKMGDIATMDECKAMLGDALVEFENMAPVAGLTRFFDYS